MLSNELSAMQAQATAPAISLIVPLDDASGRSRQTASSQVKKAIKKVAKTLEDIYPEQSVQLLPLLEEQLLQFDKHYHPGAQGAGIYVSSDYYHQCLFPFPVEEKAHIAGAFSIRELLYLEHYATGYLLLHINEQTVQCYNGKLNELEEITNQHFPLHFRDDYEYSKPAQLTSHGGYEGTKSFEKDKSTLKAIRTRNFYREADHKLNAVLNGQSIIIAGPEKDIALFREVTGHTQRIIGEIPGNYSHLPLKKLEEKCWDTIRAWTDKQEATSLSQLLGKTWPENIIEGTKKVWQAVQAGRGLKLLVEKDYACPGFIGDKAGKFYIRAPKTGHRTIADAVDDIIQAVLRKKGEVIFANNGALSEHQHIALITRY
ncbi:hypothetical protein [Chitinophaga qingshengii]|uniref:Uncharacterized protein n=1 Tax=Chitinophaga qingshengii TaxID=1569794 RepID=A0ABR7TQU1_9BACT|nr:hypothetical protein [Chitinophaga qingshengii]MBC9932843.1 hypothetical protein [Chitinophaga qingshengii]